MRLDDAGCISGSMCIGREGGEFEVLFTSTASLPPSEDTSGLHSAYFKKASRKWIIHLLTMIFMQFQMQNCWTSNFIYRDYVNEQIEVLHFYI